MKCNPFLYAKMPLFIPPQPKGKSIYIVMKKYGPFSDFI